MRRNDEWQEDDATWKLLGQATSKKAGDRFTDEVVRSARLLPEKESSWSKLFGFAPWVGVAACAVFASWIFINQPVESQVDIVAKVSNTEEKWGELADVAEAEMLSAAADHLDQFSDQELITMIGF